MFMRRLGYGPKWHTKDVRLGRPGYGIKSEEESPR